MWLQTIRASCPTGVVCGILATMADRSDELTVTHSEGKALADQVGAQFWVTSAKTGLSVPEAITSLAEEWCTANGVTPDTANHQASNFAHLTQPIIEQGPSASKCRC
eukprot:TRINITY_DN41071_c0_g1_i1.p1 TRINITY_DN41071_c0_g1~~TRINITY_DN41071_c0_g1_i1.p1  ORF type:complete len:107 (+),score=13.59 TRINITY_DN41071_c0_g1_i1:205-525(+)